MTEFIKALGKVEEPIEDKDRGGEGEGQGGDISYIKDQASRWGGWCEEMNRNGPACFSSLRN